jgi:ribosomal protein L6P/L9E
MSRLAKRPIAIPAKTESPSRADASRSKAPRARSRARHRLVSVEVVAEGVQVATKRRLARGARCVGTYASHVRNMIEGVNQGFSKKLLIEGVGYKWDVQGKTLNSRSASRTRLRCYPRGPHRKATKARSPSRLRQRARRPVCRKHPRAEKARAVQRQGHPLRGEVIRRKQGKKAA